MLFRYAVQFDPPSNAESFVQSTVYSYVILLCVQLCYLGTLGCTDGPVKQKNTLHMCNCTDLCYLGALGCTV